MVQLNAILTKEEDMYIAKCPEAGTISQGHTIEEAVENLKEAVSLYLEEMGEPEEYSSSDTFVVKFEVNSFGKTPKVVG